MDYDIRTDGRVQHGEPVAHRSDRYGHDKFFWPSGLELTVYDDGRVKLGGPYLRVSVTDVSNFAPGGSASGAHVIAEFTRRPGAPPVRPRTVMAAAELDAEPAEAAR